MRVTLAYDGGGIGKRATGTLLVDETEVAQAKIPRTIGVRFSLDETFDVGEEAGTPVIEDYADKMPYAFTGALKRFAAVSEPEKLTEEEKQRLHEELSKALMTVQ